MCENEPKVCGYCSFSTKTVILYEYELKVKITDDTERNEVL